MKAKRNISLLFLIKLAKWFMLYMPVSFLFYIENGFGNKEYLLLHAIYSGVIAFLEIPSGYIADVWGRRPAIILGGLLGTIGFGFYSISYSLLGFLMAEILLGIGQSLLSGADTALLYDSLKEAKKEKEYIKIEGRITALGNVAEAMAGIFVSIIVFKLYRNYFVLQTVLTFIAFIAALFLYEPAKEKASRKVGFSDILSIVNTTLRKNKILRNFVVFSSIIGFASLCTAWLAQPVFFRIGIEEKHFGFAWVFLNAIVAVGSITASKVNSGLGLKGSLIYIGIPLSFGFGLVALNLTYYAFIPLVLLFFVRGTAHPILKNYINQNTDSSKRATVLSLRSLIIRFLFFGMGPLLGVVSEKFSLEFALYLCGITVLVPAFIVILLILLGINTQSA